MKILKQPDKSLTLSFTYASCKILCERYFGNNLLTTKDAYRNFTKV